MTSNMDKFRLLAQAIKDSARVDKNPNIGRVMPKGWEHKERYE